MSEAPLHQDEVCYGIDLRNYDAVAMHKRGKINLQFVFDMCEVCPDKATFFDFTQSPAMGDFNRVAGVFDPKQQIIDGVPEEEIRKSWSLR